MATIALQGLRFFARHGYYEEEQKLGNTFLLDVVVNADTQMAAATDELYEPPEEEEEETEPAPTTVNYELLYFICQREMKEPAKLLENVVERIAARIQAFDNVTGYLVRLRKQNPPLGGAVDSAWVMTSGGDLDFSLFKIFQKLL